MHLHLTSPKVPMNLWGTASSCNSFKGSLMTYLSRLLLCKHFKKNRLTSSELRQNDTLKSRVDLVVWPTVSQSEDRGFKIRLTPFSSYTNLHVKFTTTFTAKANIMMIQTWGAIQWCVKYPIRTGPACKLNPELPHSKRLVPRVQTVCGLGWWSKTFKSWLILMSSPLESSVINSWFNVQSACEWS